MFCHICNEKMSLQNLNRAFGRVFKEYRCSAGHRKDIEKDTKEIVIKEYVLNSIHKRRVVVDEDA